MKLGILGVITFLLVMLVSNVSAEHTTIDSITTDPDPAEYVYQGIGYQSSFSIIVHVTNPPPGGEVSCTNCEYIGSTTIDDNGMASFPYVGMQINYPYMHQCPGTFFLQVIDNQGNLVASEQVWISPHIVPTIIWSDPAAISSITPLSSILDASAQWCSGGSWDGHVYYSSVPGTFVYTPAEGTVLSAGTHTLHVDFIPDDTETYTNASMDVTIEVFNPVDPTDQITWNNPADIIYGTPLTSTQLNAVSQWVDGTFVYTPAAGTVLSAGTHTLHVDFIPDDAETYTTASKDVTINVNAATPPQKTTPTITWSNPADISYGTALDSTQLCASASVFGTFTYTPAAGTVLNAGTQTLHVDFTPTDDVNYTAAQKEVTINVLEKPVIPVADFSASPTTGKAPLTVAFIDTSPGSPTSWSWNFGDKSTSTAQSLKHTYNKAGKYTVSLTVKNELGNNTRKITNYIVVTK